MLKKAAERAKKTTERERSRRKSDALYAEVTKAIWRTKSARKSRNIAATLLQEQSDNTQYNAIMEWDEFKNNIVENNKKFNVRSAQLKRRRLERKNRNIIWKSTFTKNEALQKKIKSLQTQLQWAQQINRFKNTRGMNSPRLVS